MPESHMDSPTSSTTSIAIRISIPQEGSALDGPLASRNKAAARTSRVRASGQSVKINAVSAPYKAASSKGPALTPKATGIGSCAAIRGAKSRGTIAPKISPSAMPTAPNTPICIR